MESEFEDAQSFLLPHSPNQSKFRSFLISLDIFSFLPVPKGDSLSTKRSICGSLSVFILFISYVGFSLYEFFGHNIPSTNQYYLQLNNDLQVKAPSFAFSFITGENLNETIKDRSYFDFAVEQVTVYSDPNIPRIYKQIDHGPCNQSEISNWLNFTLSNFLLCPKSQLSLKGLIYNAPIHHYARVTFTLCNYSNPEAGCKPRDEILDAVSKGRIFFFLKKPSDTDFATDKVYPGGFYLRNYFVVPGLYNRAELQIQVEDTYQYPDWLTRLSQRSFRDLSLSKEQFYVSKTPNPYLSFMVWMRLDATTSKSEVKYLTIIDYISKWGALWGVFMTIGALYFLRYNKKQFYSKNPEWDEFEKEIAVIRSLQNRVRNPSRLLETLRQRRESSHDIFT